MIEFSEVKLDTCVLHLVGNSGREEGFSVAKHALRLPDEDYRFKLMDYFLNAFNTDEYYRFGHVTSLEMNELYMYCSYIFEDDSRLYDQSVNILNHLYNKSSHPSVKAGELYVVLFRDILIEDELVDAVGIFKAEKKSTFIQLNIEEGNDFGLAFAEGSSMEKMDKGALILNTYQDEGFRVLCVDLKSSDARFWKDEFLMVEQLQDDAFHTKQYMGMVKDFVQEVAAKDIDKREQVQILNKTVDYFDKHEQFDYNEFCDSVFKEEEQEVLKEKFESYKTSYREDYPDMPDNESFFISHKALKSMKRKFKNLIKLDTQIEIKLNSPDEEHEEFIERGFDEERQMHFYKVFFRSES